MPNLANSTRKTNAEGKIYDKLERGSSETLRSSNPVMSASLLKPPEICPPASRTRRPGVLQFYNVPLESLKNKNELFVDPEFPPQNSSIYGSETGKKNIKWMRPWEITPNAAFIVDGPSQFDVKQGEFGDCWILAALASLAMHEQLFDQVVPKGQSYDPNVYSGKFRFRFWEDGAWVDVAIDDFLPMKSKTEYVGSRSATINEFWSALVEKAYAKLYGSYAALDGGYTHVAMEAFTGGLSEIYDTKNLPSNMFSILLAAHEKRSLIGCSYSAYKQDDDIARLIIEHEGLIPGHAYSVTHVTRVSSETRAQKLTNLIRVRNPWGQNEWTGAWSDKSTTWSDIPAQDRDELRENKENGEFWMSFEDFTKHFDKIDVCYLNSKSKKESESSLKSGWETSLVRGKWVCGDTADGASSSFDDFQSNPQHRMRLDKESLVIVALTYKSRGPRGRIVHEYHDISFSIYYLGADPEKKLRKPLDRAFFEDGHNKELSFESITRDPFIPQTTAHFNLQPGAYCIIPYINDPDVQGAEYMLRVYSEHPNNLEEYARCIGVDDVVENEGHD